MLQAAIFEHCNELAWVEDVDDRRRLWCDILQEYNLPQELGSEVWFFTKFKFHRARSLTNATVVAATKRLVEEYAKKCYQGETEDGRSETSKN